LAIAALLAATSNAAVSLKLLATGMSYPSDDDRTALAERESGLVVDSVLRSAASFDNGQTCPDGR
jgi:hypothetical protein